MVSSRDSGGVVSADNCTKDEREVVQLLHVLQVHRTPSLVHPGSPSISTMFAYLAAGESLEKLDRREST